MNRNILKKLHNDLEKLILNKYANLSICRITIDHEKTKIFMNVKDKNKYLGYEIITFENWA